MNSTPACDPGETGSVRMAPHMSVCPRGSSNNARRLGSAWAANHSHFSSIVRPRGEGKPSMTSRSGPPSAWASMVRIKMGRKGWKGALPALPRLFCRQIFFLLRHPRVEVRLALDGHEATHTVVTEPAQL